MLIFTRIQRMSIAGLVILNVIWGCERQEPIEQMPHNSRGIAAVANNNFSLSNFFFALQMTSHVTLLTEEGPFTVFAPSNSAFGPVFGADVRAGIMSNAGLMGQIVPYHIHRGTLRLDNLPVARNQVFTMSNDMELYVSRMENERDSVVTINGALVSPTLLEASNGLVYTTEALLTPSASLSLSELVSDEASFTFFNVALQRSGLAERLGGSEEMTVFAPNNAAFMAAGISNTDQLHNMSPEVLQQLILSHITSGRKYLYDYILMADVASNNYVETMLDGGIASVDALPNFSWISDTGYRGISITKTDTIGVQYTVEIDIQHTGRTARNGVLHGINTMLLP